MTDDFPIKFKQDVQIVIDYNEPYISFNNLLFNKKEQSKFLAEKWSFKIDKNDKMILTIRVDFLDDLNDIYKFKYLELFIQHVVDFIYNSTHWYKDYKFTNKNIYDDNIFDTFFIQKRRIIEQLLPIDDNFIIFCNELIEKYKYETYGCKLPCKDLCKNISHKYKISERLITKYLDREIN